MLAPLDGKSFVLIVASGLAGGGLSGLLYSALQRTLTYEEVVCAALFGAAFGGGPGLLFAFIGGKDGGDLEGRNGQVGRSLFMWMTLAFISAPPTVILGFEAMVALLYRFVSNY